MNSNNKTNRKEPSEKDKRWIIGVSGGRCNMCRTPVFIENECGERARLGDFAHIVAASDIGPRGDKSVSPELRAKADNLFMLCKTCHSKADQQPQEYTVSRLMEIRDQHYEWVQECLGTRILKKPRFHYLLYINQFRVDMYAVASSIGSPSVNQDLPNVNSIRDLRSDAVRLASGYANVLNHEELYGNLLSDTTGIEDLSVGSYWYFEPVSFRTKNVDDKADPVEAWEKQESIIYRKFDGWKLICQIDPRWAVSNSAYGLFRSGIFQTTGIVHINRIVPKRGEVIASPLFLSLPD